MTSYRTAVALVLLSAAHSAFCNSSQLTDDQKSALDSARVYAMQYSARLPNFICTQVTRRDSARANTRQVMDSGIGGAYYGASDQIVEKVSYFNQKENYEIVSINGKKAAGIQHNELAGARSAGEFGSALRVLFDPNTHTVFSGHRMEDVRGRRTYVFAFMVPKATGMPVSTAGASAPTLVAYHGLVFFDGASQQILRVTTNFDFPRGFSIQQAYRIVDYESVAIAGKSYNLPAHAEIRMQSGADSFVNKIEFKVYREFAVQSTIRFGVLDEHSDTNPAAPVNGGPASAQTQAAPIEAASNAAAAGDAALQVNESAHQTAAPAVAADAGPVLPESSPQSAQHDAAAIAAAPVAANTVVAPKPATAAMSPKTQEDAVALLHLSTDLVLVPVVVRDASGHAKTGLGKEDFQILDKGKRQEITSFTVEQREGAAAIDDSSSSAPATAQKSPTGVRTVPNYIVYLFDDINLNEEELLRAREAARQSVDALQAGDLAALVTTSGLVQSTMSTDREKFKEALLKMHAQPLGGTSAKGCPDIDAYLANQILGQQGGNPLLLEKATSEAGKCLRLADTNGAAKMAEDAVRAMARDAVMMGERQTHQWLAQLRDVVRWVGKAPGRRTVLLVSPGFVPINAAQMEGAEIVDEAIRSEVTISALDARGVYGENPVGAIEDKTGDPDFRRMKAQVMYAEATSAADVLEEMTGGTGGAFVRNTNNLNAGLKILATPPECIYVLGFKPQKVKLDGSVHPLVVKLNTKEKLELQARQGYVAARR